jgi:hypothetical protein
MGDGEEPRAHGEPLDAELRHRRAGQGENRLVPTVAVLVAVVAYALLPEDLLFAPRYLIAGVEVVLLVALVASNPRRLVRRTRLSRGASVLLAATVIVTNLVALGMLVRTLTQPDAPAGSLLLGAMQVWLTNVVGFALLYWELDRGGPVARRRLRRDELPPADWRFSQDEVGDNVEEVRATASGESGWVPVFVDYLYLSLTSSSAFSPTDTMPLSTRAKALMGLQATAALLTTLLVIARAVGSFGS